MTTEEDIIKIEEAKGCNSCPCWLKHCNAECCKIIFINVKPSKLKGSNYFLKIYKPKLSLNDQRYYLLRDVKYTRGYLIFPKHRIVTFKDQVAYVHRCKWLLPNNLCKGHPDNKPEICKSLNVETAMHAEKYGFRLTDNCLFKYKLMEDDKNVKRKENN